MPVFWFFHWNLPYTSHHICFYYWYPNATECAEICVPSRWACCLLCSQDLLQSHSLHRALLKAGTFHMGWSSFPRCGMCCLQSPRRLNSHFVSFIVVVNAWCSNLSFTLEGMFWHVPDCGLCRNFTELTSTWIFIEFITLPLECMCLTKVFSMLTPSYSCCQIINVMNQNDVLQCVQMVQMSSS